MKTVVGLFDLFEDAGKAVQDLRAGGFYGKEISLVVRDANGEYSRSLAAHAQEQSARSEEEAVENAVNGTETEAYAGGLAGLLTGLVALSVPGIGPVIAAGPLVTTLAGTGVGAVAGGMVGVLAGMGVSEEHSNFYAEGVRRGGTLVIVHATEDRESTALTILNRYKPIDILGHAKVWREKDWRNFDSQAAPLIRSEMEYNQGFDPPERDFIQVSRSRHFPLHVEDGAFEIPEVDYGDLGDDTHETMEAQADETLRLGMPVTGFPSDLSAPVDDVRQINGEAFSRFEESFRRHYQLQYGETGPGYDIYYPAYHFGYELAVDALYYGMDWMAVEPLAQKAWESREGQLPWAEVEDAVRQAWQLVTR